ncbi:polyprenyl synthetase family protein [Methylocella silvestris]|uniref:Geranylgeranyl pyrophosphate synthase n=1 Tax=Methylocella silvestris TaxID=199596 RepID=A0A2J7TDF0_METSI|nr:polyprenyl synthetase family protein [Methylocella silvestris]PNG24791.1 geranylgeranyl pyrophosphate synthase [Methylocella silvestris]
MDAIMHIESALETAAALAASDDAPPRLAAAIHYAIFPGGARIRPRLCLAVSAACGAQNLGASAAAAGAIELLHCASLAHDDLPCFDDAPTRRGKPSVHAAFGEALAVLAGDAMIVMAFESIARAFMDRPHLLPPLVQTIARAAGMPNGIAAGQGYESEPQLARSQYQRAKTGSLFVAATVAGALAAGADGAPWRMLGEGLGEAYQIADDIRDVASSPEAIGKPVGRDAALGRPSAALELGIDGAVALLKRLTREAVDSIPACPGADWLKAQVLIETLRVLPEELLRRAA